MQAVPRYKTAPQQFDFGAKQEFGTKTDKPEYRPEYKPEYSSDEKSGQYTPPHAMPVKSFRSGALQVSIWENESLGQDGMPKTYKTVSFDRRYKDKSGVWKSTNSLRINDLPRATLILQKAYEYLILTESAEDIDVQ